MPPVEWWALHAVQVLALTLAIVFSFGASRRIGGHTPYGNMLFLLTVGFWFLLLGELAFLSRNALGTWSHPGGFTDFLQLSGWALLVASVALFVTRFTPAGPRPRLRLAAAVLLPVAGMAALFPVLSPPGADPDAWIRIPYLLLDAAALGLIAGGIRRFVALRESALGRLYLFLGAAVVLKSVGDVAWAVLAAHGQSSLLATLSYPLAGAVAVVGLARHLVDMRREALQGRPVGAPWTRAEQRFLRDLARSLSGVAGGYAARTALRAAATAFERRGLAWHITADGLEAKGDDEAWQDAVGQAQTFAREGLGAAGQRAVQALERHP